MQSLMEEFPIGNSNIIFRSKSRTLIIRVFKLQILESISKLLEIMKS